MRGLATGGSRGPKGADGANGVGVPVGGTTGQVLAKNSNTDFDTEWVDMAPGEPTGASSAYVGELLFREVVGAGGQTTFDITPIPAGYDYLEIMINGRTNRAGGDHIQVGFNGDTNAANYRLAYWWAGSSTNYQVVDNRYTGDFGGSDSNSVSTYRAVLANYSSPFPKQYNAETTVRIDATASYVTKSGLSWENNGPVTRLTLNSYNSATFSQGTLCTVVGYKNRNLSQSEIPDTVQGRLTLTAGNPVTTADVTAATTLYFTPYKGNKIHLYSNGAWVLHSFAETSASLAGLAANTNFDVFGYSNSGTLALELLAWSGDTTRVTELTLQDGIYVKSGDATRRYLGTIRTTGTIGQCEDSVTKRLVWNCNNQMPRKLWKPASAGNYVYHGDWRPWENSTANRFEVVCGVAGEIIEIKGVTTIVTGNKGGHLGVGINSISVNSAFGNLGYSPTAEYHTPTAHLIDYPRMGYSYYQALEKSITAGPSWEGTVWLGGYAGQWKA